MKILIDIGHPAHVHYFRNFIKQLQKMDHEFLIIARNRKYVFELLNSYNLPFVSRGKGALNPMGKIIYLFQGDFFIYKKAKEFKPDLFLGFASFYISHVAKILGKPCVIFDDTETANFGHMLYKPFANVICSPTCFLKDFGEKHLKFDGYMELCYLHPNYFKPDKSVLKEVGIKEKENFTLLRFVAWKASHDIGQVGLTSEYKKKLVKKLTKYGKVLISSENELPAEFKKYQVNISPAKIHHILNFAALYIGEGATMASECAMLGTPAIYVNSITLGTLEEQERYGLVYCFRNSAGVLEQALELINNPNLRHIHRDRRQKMLADKIDVAAFMIWFVENYPESVGIIKADPDYQYRFKYPIITGTGS
jgi:predicted glycosyltransferase